MTRGVDDAPQELFLAGYAPLTDRGFALPCFAMAPRPNTWFAATCSIDGDHRGRISGFEAFPAENVQELPQDRFRLCRTGDPWCDVFVWNGAAYIGTPEQLWAQLQREQDDLLQRAPISLVDLALDVTGVPHSAFARSAQEYLSARYDRDVAGQWQSETFLAAATVRLRRRLRPGAAGPGALSLLAGTGGRLDLRVPTSLLDQITDSAAFSADLEQLAEQLDVRLGLIIPEAAGAAAPQPDPPKPSAGDHSAILILSDGDRARELAALVQAPEWLPVWGDRPIGQQRARLDLRRFDGDDPRLEVTGFTVAVLIADDMTNLNHLHVPLSIVLNDLAARGVPVLLAPALPRLRPSTRLTDGVAASGAAFPIAGLIDTSIARSPFWKGDQRRAVDRTVADIIVGAASLVALDGPVRDIVMARKSPPLITFAFSQLYPADRNNPRSEASCETGREERVRFSVTALKRNGLGGRLSGTVDLREPGADFGSFAAEVVHDICPDENGYVVQALPADTPPIAVRPEGWAAFSVQGPEGVTRRLGVMAAAPTLDNLAEAERADWPIVRYTDRRTLEHRLFDVDSEVTDLPAEIELPRLRRLPQNRRLAARGLDPRDVVLIPAPAYEAWKEDTENAASPLAAMVRQYRRGIEPWDRESPEKRQYAVPAHALQRALSESDPAAGRLLQAFEVGRRLSDVAPEKRGGDLRALWSPLTRPWQRYIVADGDLPIKMARLIGPQAPGQAMFMIDGDKAVPALLTSRVFRVWAHATTSRSRGWMSRFSVSSTFEAFPLPRAFALQQQEDGPPRLTCDPKSPLGRQIAKMESDFSEQAPDEVLAPPDSWQPQMKALDQLFLKAYDLGADANDLQVLQRLVTVNLQQ